MSIKEIFEKFNTSEFQFTGKIFYDEPMARHTTMRVGGNAKIFVEPKNEHSLLTLLSFINENNLPYFILGGGSNIVVSDKGLEKIVISMNALNDISLIEKNAEQKIFVQAGCTMARLVNFCVENEIAGFEEFAGLPGTVGGALFMNARSFEKEIAECVDSIEFVDLENDSEIQNPPTPDGSGASAMFQHRASGTRARNDFCARVLKPRTAGLPKQHRTKKIERKNYAFEKKDWTYKKSPFQNRAWLVTAAIFHGVGRGTKFEMQKKCESFVEARKAKGHFDFPSAGSVFKNNHEFGKPSGKIIDEAGLRGFAIGGAEIAQFHGNFILNKNHASAKDVRELVELAKKVVAQKYGFHLDCEIIFVD